jgi:transposase-like protein
MGDGALGLWAALRDVYPMTAPQRCWNHRVLNVQDKLPQRLQADARRRLRAMAEAPTRAECERQRDAYVAELRAAGQEPAAATVLRDWEDFVTFYSFPAEHWVHLRTSNPLESVFAGVRLRTDATKRMRTRETALYLVFKLIERLGQRWRCLNGGATLMRLVLDGDRFVDGVRQRPAASPAA